MVVPYIAHISIVGNINRQRPIQPEREHALRRQLYPSAARHCLTRSARSGPSCCSDRRPFTASGDRTNNCPEQSTTAHVLTRALVDTNTFFPLLGRNCL